MRIIFNIKKFLPVCALVALIVELCGSLVGKGRNFSQAVFSLFFLLLIIFPSTGLAVVLDKTYVGKIQAGDIWGAYRNATRNGDLVQRELIKKVIMKNLHIDNLKKEGSSRIKMIHELPFKRNTEDFDRFELWEIQIKSRKYGFFKMKVLKKTFRDSARDGNDPLGRAVFERAAWKFDDSLALGIVLPTIVDVENGIIYTLYPDNAVSDTYRLMVNSEFNRDHHQTLSNSPLESGVEYTAVQVMDHLFGNMRRLSIGPGRSPLKYEGAKYTSFWIQKNFLIDNDGYPIAINNGNLVDIHPFTIPGQERTVIKLGVPALDDFFHSKHVKTNFDKIIGSPGGVEKYLQELMDGVSADLKYQLEFNKVYKIISDRWSDVAERANEIQEVGHNWEDLRATNKSNALERQKLITLLNPENKWIKDVSELFNFTARELVSDPHRGLGYFYPESPTGENKLPAPEYDKSDGQESGDMSKAHHLDSLHEHYVNKMRNGDMWGAYRDAIRAGDLDSKTKILDIIFQYLILDTLEDSEKSLIRSFGGPGDLTAFNSNPVEIWDVNIIHDKYGPLKMQVVKKSVVKSSPTSGDINERGRLEEVAWTFDNALSLGIVPPTIVKVTKGIVYTLFVNGAVSDVRRILANKNLSTISVGEESFVLDGGAENTAVQVMDYLFGNIDRIHHLPRASAGRVKTFNYGGYEYNNTFFQNNFLYDKDGYTVAIDHELLFDFHQNHFVPRQDAGISHHAMDDFFHSDHVKEAFRSMSKDDKVPSDLLGMFASASHEDVQHLLERNNSLELFNKRWDSVLGYLAELENRPVTQSDIKYNNSRRARKRSSLLRALNPERKSITDVTDVVNDPVRRLVESPYRGWGYYYPVKGDAFEGVDLSPDEELGAVGGQPFEGDPEYNFRNDLGVWGDFVAEISQPMEASIHTHGSKDRRYMTLLDTEKVSNYMREKGAELIQVLPQDFLLDSKVGRCLPLSRLMAAGLSSKGWLGVQDVSSLLFDVAANLGGPSPKAVINSLISLQYSHSARLAESDKGLMTVSTIKTRLVDTPLQSNSGVYMLMGTREHAMLVGKSNVGGKESYIYFDPNFAVFKFPDSQSFEQALVEHLVSNKYGRHYRAYGNELDPEFNMRELATNKMAEVPLANGLKIVDLLVPKMTTVADSLKRVEAFRIYDQVQSDQKFRSSLNFLHAANMAESVSQATKELYETHGLDESWIPIFKNITQKGDEYRISLFNKETDQTKTLITSDRRFSEFERFYDSNLEKIRGSYIFDNGKFTRRAGIADAEHADGLNSAFIVQSILAWVNERSRSETVEGSSKALRDALTVHSYVNMGQLTFGLAQDIRRIAGIYRAVLRGGISATTQSTLSSIGHAGGTSLSVVFNVANVGLDIYELTHAENEFQKAVYATHLAFDSAFLINDIASIGLAMAGAGTASAVLGVGGALFAGLAVGGSALAEAYGKVANDAAEVGRAFNAINNAYLNGGYNKVSKRVDEKGNYYHGLEPESGAVIRTIDLERGQITFDSQYIYRTHHGLTGSGKANYFLWGNDFPKMVRDKDQAVNIREGLGLSKTAPIDAGGSTLVLPTTPKYYISYKYESLPFATTRHDTGFNLLRKLEDDERFDFDFYVFPIEYIIRKLTVEYVPTQIDVYLDDEDRWIVMPELNAVEKNKLSYALRGRGGQYRVVLRSGAAALSLGTAPDCNCGDGPRWVMDARNLSGGEVQVNKDHLMIGGVKVSLAGSSFASLKIIKKHNELVEVDFDLGTTRVLTEDDSQWPSTEALHQYLAKNDHLGRAFIEVENFIPEADQEFYGESRFLEPGKANFGRAYYQSEKDRFIYTDAPYKSRFLAGARMVAYKDDMAWFAHKDQVWLVSADRGKVLRQYTPFIWNHGFGWPHTKRVWQENGVVYWSMEQPLRNGDTVELNYELGKDSLSLVSVNGDMQLLEFITGTEAITAPDTRDLIWPFSRGTQGLFGGRIANEDLKPEAQVKASLGALITVSGKDDHKTFRYWLNTGENAARGLIHANLNSVTTPADLLLVHTVNLKKPLFYFYSQKQKALYIQQGTQGQAYQIHLPESSQGLASIQSINGQFIILGKNGTLWGLMGEQLYLAGASVGWSKSNYLDLGAGIKALLKQQAQKIPQIPLFGLKDSHGKSISVWFDTQSARMVRSGSNLNGHRVSLLGLSPDNTFAWIYSYDEMSLYRQYLSDQSSELYPDENLVVNTRVSNAELYPFLPGELDSVRRQGETLQLQSVDGLIFEIPVKTESNNRQQLVAVTQKWQDHIDLKREMVSLGAQYSLPKKVKLLGEAFPSWYLPKSHERVVASGLNTEHSIRYLGSAENDNGDYFHDATTGVLTRIKHGSSGRSSKYPYGKYSIAEVESDRILILQAAEDEAFGHLPSMQGVDKVVWTGDNSWYKYKIGPKDLSHYNLITIVNSGDHGKLVINLDHLAELYIYRNGEDLLIYDSTFKSAVVILQADKASLSKFQLSSPSGFQTLRSLLKILDRNTYKFPNRQFTWGELSG